MSAAMTNNNFAVFLTNINNHITEDELRFYMNRPGRVIFLKYFNKGSTKKNFAYVYYTCFSDAIRAVEMLDQTILYNSRLFVSMHKDNAFLNVPFPNREITNGKNSLSMPVLGNFPNIAHACQMNYSSSTYPYYHAAITHSNDFQADTSNVSLKPFDFSSFRASFPNNAVFPPTPVPTKCHPSPSATGVFVQEEIFHYQNEGDDEYDDLVLEENVPNPSSDKTIS